jgi:hypothetical protein
MKRRTIGPAFERSPAERFSEWARRNFLTLLSALAATAVWWFIINWLSDRFLNFLAGKEDDPAFSSQDPLWIAVKIIGSFILAIVICKTRAK